MCEQSAWRAEIPWEEGTEADFADFKEKMANAKISGAINESRHPKYLYYVFYRTYPQYPSIDLTPESNLI